MYNNNNIYIYQVYKKIIIFMYICKFIQKQRQMAMKVAGWTILHTEYYSTKLGVIFKTYKIAHFGVWDLLILE